ncbi:MAG: hypothetical protein HQL11_01820 [Candidatus Omnitrophica bacterium]|nr:hypothetical protein [Candidatus Omnitrophota bacterium]
MAPHIMAMSEKIMADKERRLVHETLLKSLMKDPRYPLLVVWVREDGRLLDAFGGAIKRLGLRKWRTSENNLFQAYPQIEAHVRLCLSKNEPVHFDWVGENVVGREIWLKCYFVPMIAMDCRFVCGFGFDVSKYKFVKMAVDKNRFDWNEFQYEYGLTDTEVEVCRVLSVKHVSIKELSHQMSRSKNTVNSHLRSIRRKLGLSQGKMGLKEFLNHRLKS